MKVRSELFNTNSMWSLKSILRLTLIKTGLSSGLKWRTSFMFGCTEAESYLHTWSLQNWSLQCVLNVTFSGTALADHIVALGFKQAGTRFLVLRQKAAASDNSLGSIRHLPYPRHTYIQGQWGLNLARFVCLVSVGATAQLFNLPTLTDLAPYSHSCLPTNSCCPTDLWNHCLPLQQRPQRYTSYLLYFCPPLSKLEKIKCYLLPACLPRGAPITLFSLKVSHGKWDASTAEQISELQVSGTQVLMH